LFPGVNPFAIVNPKDPMVRKKSTKDMTTKRIGCGWTAGIDARLKDLKWLQAQMRLPLHAGSTAAIMIDRGQAGVAVKGCDDSMTDKLGVRRPLLPLRVDI